MEYRAGGLPILAITGNQSVDDDEGARKSQRQVRNYESIAAVQALPQKVANMRMPLKRRGTAATSTSRTWRMARCHRDAPCCCGSGAVVARAAGVSALSHLPCKMGNSCTFTDEFDPE
jgi:hypothetical protein